jgi:DNA-binding NtrC family response regulator
MAKILGIDDEQGIRSLLDTLPVERVMTWHLPRVVGRAWSFFRRERPDVVVLDLRMPEMDGVTVLKQLRSVDLKLPVIILTGAGTPEREQQVRSPWGDRVRRERIFIASTGRRQSVFFSDETA